MEPIFFIVGYPRSGTTFIEKKMFELLNCSMSNEVDFLLKNRTTFTKNYDFKQKDVLDAFIEKLLNQRFFNWYDLIYSKKYGYSVRITKNDILKELRGYDVTAVLLSIFSTIRNNCRKKHILCKDPNLTGHIDYISELFPTSRFIHIVRDGRDCYLSMKKVKWGDGNIFTTATNWNQAVLSARQNGLKLGDRYLEIKYEDLLSFPSQTFDQIQHFVCGKIQPALSETLESEIKNSAFYQNFNKWKSALSPKQICLFDSIASKGLNCFQYDCNTEISNLSRINKLYYRLENKTICIFKRHFSNLPF